MYKAYLEKLESLKGEEVVKVELGLSDDLKKISSKAEVVVKEINSESEDLSDLFTKIKDISSRFNKLNKTRSAKIKEAKSLFKEFNSVINDIQSQAKQLGVAPKDIPNFSNSLKINNNLRSAANDMQKYSDINL